MNKEERKAAAAKKAAAAEKKQVEAAKKATLILEKFTPIVPETQGMSVKIKNFDKYGVLSKVLTLTPTSEKVEDFVNEAVEKILHSRLTGQMGFNKSTVIEVTTTKGNLKSKLTDYGKLAGMSCKSQVEVVKFSGFLKTAFKLAFSLQPADVYQMVEKLPVVIPSKLEVIAGMNEQEVANMTLEIEKAKFASERMKTFGKDVKFVGKSATYRNHLAIMCN